MALTPTIIDFTTDPQVLGISLSPAQETLQRAIYGPAARRDPTRSVARMHGARDVSRPLLP
jgi:hypothetical protein